MLVKSLASAVCGFGLLTLIACVPQLSSDSGTKAAKSGRELYEAYCAACHGDTGKGDGPMAASLSKKPADLTRISARNNGVFPVAKVMSTIDGYTRKNDHGSVMPEFGLLMTDAPTVLIDTGDGVSTPAPRPLVFVVDYLRSLQGT